MYEKIRVRNNLKYGTGHPMKMSNFQSLYKSRYSNFFSSGLVLVLDQQQHNGNSILKLLFSYFTTSQI